jgi:hypothetical protein
MSRHVAMRAQADGSGLLWTGKADCRCKRWSLGEMVALPRLNSNFRTWNFLGHCWFDTGQLMGLFTGRPKLMAGGTHAYRRATIAENYSQVQTVGRPHGDALRPHGKLNFVRHVS